MPRTPASRPSSDPIAELRASLARGAPPAPVYLLHGNEPLLLDRAEAIITRAASGGEEGAVDRQVLDAEETDARAIVLAASAFPMLGGRRLVVVRNAEKLSAADPLVAYLDDPSPTTTLVLATPKADFRQSLFQALRARAVVVECRTPWEDRIGGWIESEAAAAGRSIDAEGVELLRLSAGSTLAELSKELEKLFLYAGPRTALTAADVAAVTGTSRRHSVFDLQRAIGARDTRAALAVALSMIEAGENMTRCVAQLGSWLEKLWLLPETGLPPAEAASLLGVKPFFVREYLNARRNFPGDRLDECFLALRDADVALKSSGGTPAGIMTLLLHALTRPSPRPVAGPRAR